MMRKWLWMAMVVAAMMDLGRSTPEARAGGTGVDSCVVPVQYRRPYGATRYYSVYYRARRGAWHYYTTTRNIGMAQRIANMLEGFGYGTYIRAW